MSRSHVFWPIVLILVGIALLLENLRLLPPQISVWDLIWPLILIALGLRIFWRIGRPRRWSAGEQVAIPLGTETVAPAAAPAGQATTPVPAAGTTRTAAAQEAAVPLAEARRARVHVHHGAGRLDVGSGAAAGQLLSGFFAGGLDYRTTLEGDLLAVEMHVPSSARSVVGPWNWDGLLDWSFALNNQVPLALELETGANETHLDLTDLLVTDLRLRTGASATQITLPAHAGQTQVRVEAGAAAVKIRVPAGVAARIRVQGALLGTGVDEVRFPRQGDYHQSVDYDTAANKVDIRVESAVGSVDVR